MRISFFFIMLMIFSVSCQNSAQDELFIPKNIVIAHRGTTYWAPEETEAAYRWARDIGAHYLEVDIQRSKDGVLMALHDDQLTRTTNIAEVFPERSTLASSAFTYEELLNLDAGTWFNDKFQDRAKEEFGKQAALYTSTSKALYFDSIGHVFVVNDEAAVYYGGHQQILSLEDVVRIAEGYRIAKDEHGNRLFEKYKLDGQWKYRFFYVKDEDASRNCPGVYIETKEPHLFPGVEGDLYKELSRLGWNQLTKPFYSTKTEKDGFVNIAHSSSRVILQTFSPESLKELNRLFKGKVPITFLLWLGDPNMPSDDSLVYHQNLKFAKENGAHIIGPSIAGPPNNYDDLLSEEQFIWIREMGFLIHPYSFDTHDQTLKYGPKSDGMFTNRADLTLEYYQNKSY